MRVLIVANCAHKAYYLYTKIAHPTWDIRSVTTAQLRDWLENNNEKFFSFADSVDIIVGFTNSKGLESLAPKAIRVLVPPFTFRAYMPDMLAVKGLEALLIDGDAHSRIALIGWINKLNQSDVAKLFCERTYDKLNYFSHLDVETQRLIELLKKCGINDHSFLQNWIAKDRFLCFPVHPDVRFLFDLLHSAMKTCNINPGIPNNELLRLRESLPNYLFDGIHWPIYREIAGHYCLEPWPSSWKLAQKRGGNCFGIEEMISRTYKILDSAEDARAKIHNIFGGEEKCQQILEDL